MTRRDRWRKGGNDERLMGALNMGIGALVMLAEAAARPVVRVQALGGEEFRGQVKRSAWALDPKGRMLRTEIDLPNPGGRLRPGMYAYAAITVEHTGVLAVPAAAVATGSSSRS
jgi:multidrug efflux pump subunit AcrA (membrane-fusion protein)